MAQALKKALFYTLLLLNLAIIIAFWWSSSAVLFKQGLANSMIALGRIAGLLLVYSILLQVLFIGRVRWLEHVFGLDKLARIHHTTGFSIISLVILHPLLLSIGYSINAKTGFITQLLQFQGFKYVLLADIAAILFIIIIIVSIFIVWKKLKYETWYYTHLFIYAAILLAFFHQIINGGDFIANKLFVIYWYALYAFVLLNLLFFRFFRPLYKYSKHRFSVEKVEQETDNSTSIYIYGNDLEDFHIRPGQFMIFRFLNKKFIWQTHPFSLSGLDYEHKKYLRITVKASGDYTKELQNIRTGTRVLIDGPYGIFTEKLATKHKFLFIAGGVGITPIRALIEHLGMKGRDMILLYANRTKKDIIFSRELDKLSEKYELKVHHVLSDEKWVGEKGFVDKEKIMRLVKDYKERDIYICGPPPMMDKLIKQLKEMGVKSKHIHYEKFSL